MNEYDKRQLDLMLQKIHAFNEGYIHLSDLIYDLEALLDISPNEDQNWKDIFRSYWWDLEQVYATALDNEKLYLDSEDQRIVNNAIGNLKKLIEMKLC